MKQKPLLDDKLSATSFFAQLREKMQGPIVRKRSPSPPPVITIPDDVIGQHSQSSVTEIVLDEDEGEKKGENEHPKPAPSTADAVDGDRARSHHVNSQKVARVPFESVSVNNGASDLMHLPFPPGTELVHPMFGQTTLLDPLKILPITPQKKTVSITRDLPMPPGKFYPTIIK